MGNKNYIKRLKKVKNDIESMLDFEQRALDKWRKPKTQEQADKQRDYTKPIVRTIVAYQYALRKITHYFPELNEPEKLENKNEK